MPEGVLGILIITVVYTFFVGVIAFYAKRGGTQEFHDFAVTSYTIGPIALGFTLAATNYSAFAFLGQAGMFYVHGMSWFMAVGPASGMNLIIAWVIARRLWVLGRKFKYVSFVRLLEDFYESKAIGLIVAIVLIVFTIPYFAVQIMGAGYIFNEMTGHYFPYIIAPLFFAVVCVLYTYIGGLRAVVWTDVFQGGFMFVIMVLSLGLILYGAYGGFRQAFISAATVCPESMYAPGKAGFFNFANQLGMFSSLSFGLTFSPFLVLRYFAARNLYALKWGFVVQAIFMTLFHMFTGPIGMGTMGSGLEYTVADTIIPILAFKYLPTILAALVLVGALASMHSTADSQIHASSVLVTEDIWKKYIDPKASEKQLFYVSKIAVVVVGIITFFIALRMEGMLVQITALSTGGFMQVMPLVIGALYWKRASKWGALSGLVGGLAVQLYFQFFGSPLGWYSYMWGIVVNVILFVFVSVITKPMSDIKISQFQTNVTKTLLELQQIKINVRPKDKLISNGSKTLPEL